MGLTERQAIIAEMEEQRKSRVICYLTSTRPNTAFQIGHDVVPRLYEHLKALRTSTSKPRVDLFLHSNGGDGVASWRIVTLIREYASEFNVIVPYRGFSAATLIALGADKIFMHPMGMVGPTDPTVANPFNPTDPNNPQGRIGISVEDLYSYIAFIKEDLGIKGESELVQAFATLTDKIHPLALGNVKRFYSQARMMAKKLLSLHMNEKTEHSAIQEIADNLNSKLYFHGHPINRTEAKSMGLKAEGFANEAEENLVWRLYSDFAQDMRMDDEFNPILDFLKTAPGRAAIAPGSAPGTMTISEIDPLFGACVESLHGAHHYTQRLQVVGGRDAAGAITGTAMALDQGWAFQPPAPIAQQQTLPNVAVTPPVVTPPAGTPPAGTPPAGTP